MSTLDQRRRWRQHHEEAQRIADDWEKRGGRYPPPTYPPMPSDLAGLACGATTKRYGTPCKRRDIYLSGRCSLHGGLSTGPKTPEGKARAALNGRCPKRPKQSS